MHLHITTGVDTNPYSWKYIDSRYALADMCNPNDDAHVPRDEPVSAKQ
jgi:hypothetical protein